VFGLNSQSPQLDLRAASWLLPYLVGLGAIVYVSDWGPTNAKGVVTGPNWIPLWWDIVAVVLFSLVIYYWAMAVALPRERIQQMVDEVVLVEEEGVFEAPAPVVEGAGTGF
jgi:hypothetical protein